MSSIVQLTPSQREALFALVRYQHGMPEEVRFLGPDRGTVKIQTDHEDVGVEVQSATIELWDKCNYISLRTGTGHHVGMATIFFVLRQEAFDYASFMAKPAPVRGLIRFWNWMVDDMPAFLWGVLGAVVIELVSRLIS